eukprot:scaffold21087_cov31-Attheya_sp.AAC.1
MQVARGLEGLRSAGLRPPGWIDMDRCVRHRRGLAGGADIGGPGCQSCSCGEDPCGEDPVSEVWPRETIPSVESSDFFTREHRLVPVPAYL